MENDVEHLGNDLGINGKSSTRSSLSSNSEFQMLNHPQAVTCPINPKNVLSRRLQVIASGSACFNQQAFKTIL
jgi:hypothetical protein